MWFGSFFYVYIRGFEIQAGIRVSFEQNRARLLELFLMVLFLFHNLAGIGYFIKESYSNRRVKYLVSLLVPDKNPQLFSLKIVQ